MINNKEKGKENYSQKTVNFTIKGTGWPIKCTVVAKQLGLGVNYIVVIGKTHKGVEKENKYTIIKIYMKETSKMM